MAKPSGSTSLPVRDADREPSCRRLFERSGFGFAAVDAAGRVIEANAAFLRPFGVPDAAELPLLAETVSPKDRAVLAFALQSHLPEQAPWEIRFRRGDGSEFWMLVSFAEPPSLPDEAEAPALIVQTIDIDERKRNALELAERESRWNHALESAGQGVWDHDFTRGDLFYSRQWRAIRGLGPDAVIDAALDSWICSVHPDDRAHVREQIRRQEAGETRFNVFSYREKHRDGQWIWIESRGAVVEYGPDGRPSRIAGTDTDITERKEAEERLAQMSRRLELALGISNIGVFEVNLRTGESKWDARMLEMYGFAGTPDDAAWEAALHPEDRVRARERVAQALAQRRDYVNEFRIVRADGEIRHIRGRAAYHVDFTGVPRLIGANWDVTEDVRLQEELQRAKVLAEARNEELEAARARIEYTALHDHLTGLPNRRFLDEAIETAAVGARESGERLAVLHIDLDRFKEINDTLGHLAGDYMLKQVADVLKRSVRMFDVCTRFGGEEFAILMPGSSVANAMVVAERIRTRVVASSRDDTTLPPDTRVTVSLGLAALTPEVTSQELIARADRALYRAKNEGKNCIRTV